VLARGFAVLRGRGVAVTLLGVLALAAVVGLNRGTRLFVIYDGEQLIVHQTDTEDAGQALHEAGIRLSRNDTVSLPESTAGGVVEVRIERSQTVHMDVHGERYTLSTLGGTVGAVLSRSGITTGGFDEITPDVSTPVTSGMTISVVRREIVTEYKTEEIPFWNVRAPASELLVGKERLAQEGVVGERRHVYEITLRNGVPVSRVRVRIEVTTEPQNEIIEYGTRKPDPPKPKPAQPSITLKENAVAVPLAESGGGLLTTPSGEELAYGRVLEVTATAYTTEGRRQKRTASGTQARVGAIAVDPKVIPLGSKVYVEIPGGKWFYGLAVCEDTGGVIKGNKIDLFFNTESECMRFGRRKAIVYVLD
jgi:3D (Asp-Asp-Asp) domain-containing protein